MAVKSISIYPDSTQIVTGAGEIVRKDVYFTIDWTESRPGYVDVGYTHQSVNPEDVAALVYELVKDLSLI